MNQRKTESSWQQEITLGEGCKADYLSQDGKILVEVKTDPKGLRRFHEGVFKLARSLLRRPEIERGYLLIVSPHVSRDRLRGEWEAAKNLFAPQIANRLAIAAADREGIWIEPTNGPFLELQKLLESHAVGENAVPPQEVVVKPLARQKHIEVLKVLLNRWLRREGPIPIGKLAEQVGCVYPTTTQALKQLGERNHLLRHSNRSVELRSFPQMAWQELLVLSDSWRQPIRYVDASGGKPDYEYLLKRLDRIKPPHVALGGVAAARYWHSDFDLHGIPRIDLSLHVPLKRVNLDFMRKLDPALKQVDQDDRSAAVVIHPLFRKDSLYAAATINELPYADPIETVLDLNEMGLTAQAGELLAHFRPDIRLP